VPPDPAGPPSPDRASISPALSLLQDGSLTLRVHPALASAASLWIPTAPASAQDAPAAPATDTARIRVVPARARDVPLPAGEPTVEMLRARAWLRADGDRAVLSGPPGGVRGVVDLARRRAALGVPGTAPFAAEAEADLACALTIAAALLLGRGGRALLHAGAVVAPDGLAWVLVGDSRSGKTTTCATLIAAGWDWLADDQVVVGADPAPGQVRVEGWPRAFTLDEGYAAGGPSGRRAPADPAGLGPGRWRRSAPLGGVLITRVEPDRPTALEPVHPAEVLGALVRQSPWLLADRRAAPGVLALLAAVSKRPGHRLRTGLDSWANPALLQTLVSETTAPLQLRTEPFTRGPGERIMP
jgi:hypothetical protein